MARKILQDEIDILGLVITIWQNQWKIYIILAITIILSLGYYLSKSSSYYVSTKLEPISIFEERKYASYNLYLKSFFPDKFNSEDTLNKELQTSFETPFQTINKTYLFKLFLNALKQGLITKDIIKKSNLIDKKDYIDNQKYEDAVSSLSDSIRLLLITEDPKNPEWIIKFRTEDINKWNNFLSLLEQPLNENVHSYLNNSLEQLILTQKKFLSFKLEDLIQKIKIQTSKEKDSAYLHYTSRMEFLEEQALIARSLNIENYENYDLTNTEKSQRPYYSRGYRLIEEELRLISNMMMSNKQFTSNINQLELQKTELLIHQKNIERFEKLVKESPIKKNEIFVAGKINLLSTNYTDDKISLERLLAYALLLGTVLGVLFVVTQQAIRNRKSI